MDTQPLSTVSVEQHKVDELCKTFGFVRRWLFDEADSTFVETLSAPGDESTTLFSSLKEAQAHACKDYIDKAQQNIDVNEPLLHSWRGWYRLNVTRHIGNHQQKASIEKFLSELKESKEKSGISLDNFLAGKTVKPLPESITTSPLLSLGEHVFELNASEILSAGKVVVSEYIVSSCVITAKGDFASYDDPDFSLRYYCEPNLFFTTDEGVSKNIVQLRNGQVLFRSQDAAKQHLEKVIGSYRIEYK